MSRITFVVPAFQEGEVIGRVVRDILTAFPASNVVVVDDSSRDNTSTAAAAAGATVVRHPVNLGQGAALQTGFDYVKIQGWTTRDDYVVTYDADGQHSLKDVMPSVDALNAAKADVALGSRFMGKTEGMPMARQMVVRLGILYNWLSTGLLLNDAHNGFRILRGNALQHLRIDCNRMAHASEILNELRRLSIPYCEVPCTITYTDYSLQKGQKARNSLSIIGNHLLYLMFRI